MLEFHKLQRLLNASDDAPDVPKLPIRRIDSLFSNETLGFAHFDMEGGELDTLKGAAATIRRDQPVLTVELFVHKDKSYREQLLRLISDLGYSTYMVDEVCGWNLDCRNLLCLPRTRFAHTNSHTLNLAVGSRALLGPIHSDTIAAAVCCRQSPRYLRPGANGSTG